MLPSGGIPDDVDAHETTNTLEAPPGACFLRTSFVLLSLLPSQHVLAAATAVTCALRHHQVSVFFFS